MHLPTTLLTFLLSALPTISSPAPPPPPAQQPITDNLLPHPQHAPSSSPPHPQTFPSKHASTILARRLLALSPTGSLTTSFPPLANLTTDPAYRYTPDLAAAHPIALPEYIADCEGSGNPTMILLDISTAARNARASGWANVSLSVDWWAGYERVTGRRARSPASLPRVVVLGGIEEMGEEEVKEGKVRECFWERHGDARAWEPGSRWGAHSGRWVRLRVEGVYWVGGFGDRAYIGWLDVEEWRAVKGSEIEGVRLPGEDEDKDEVW